MLSRKISYLILIVTAILFYVFFIEKLSFYTLVFVLALPIVLFIIVLIGKFCIKYELSSISETAIKKDNCKFLLTITNKSFFPFPTAIINIDYKNKLSCNTENIKISIPIYSKTTQKLIFTLSSEYCGILNVKIRNITLFDYIKLFSMNVKIKKSTDVCIIPNFSPTPIPDNFTTINAENSNEFSKIKSGDDASEIFELKDYIPGDKINRIHWNLSSKQNHLITKHYSLAIDSPIAVIIDINFDLDKTNIYNISTALEYFYSISFSLIDSGITHELYINGFNESLTISDINILNQTYIDMLNIRSNIDCDYNIINRLIDSKSKLFIVTNKNHENYDIPEIPLTSELKCFFTCDTKYIKSLNESENIHISLIDAKNFVHITDDLLI